MELTSPHQSKLQMSQKRLAILAAFEPCTSRIISGLQSLQSKKWCKATKVATRSKLFANLAIIESIHSNSTALAMAIGTLQGHCVPGPLEEVVQLQLDAPSKQGVHDLAKRVAVGTPIQVTLDASFLRS